MTQRGHRSRTGWTVLAVLAALTSAAQRSPAEEVERRTFAISVDGKPCGETQMVIERRDDGSEVVSHNAYVFVKLLVKYEYSYRGTEIWKGGKLVGLRGTCNDNGKRFEVAANAEGNGLRVVVNNQERLLQPEIWTSSYWKLADAKYHNQPITLLDSDRGQELPRQLHFVATEQMAVAGQTQNCQHFRVVGGSSPVELWYDAQHRLVREDFVELGHRTVLQLTNLRR